MFLLGKPRVGCESTTSVLVPKRYTLTAMNDGTPERQYRSSYESGKSRHRSILAASGPQWLARLYKMDFTVTEQAPIAHRYLQVEPQF